MGTTAMVVLSSAMAAKRASRSAIESTIGAETRSNGEQARFAAWRMPRISGTGVVAGGACFLGLFCGVLGTASFEPRIAFETVLVQFGSETAFATAFAQFGVETALFVLETAFETVLVQFGVEIAFETVLVQFVIFGTLGSGCADFPRTSTRSLLRSRAENSGMMRSSAAWVLMILLRIRVSRSIQV